MMDSNGQIGGTLQLPFFPDWNAVATGEYNGDGSVDILWQADNGFVAEWLMGNGIVAWPCGSCATRRSH